MKEVFGYVFSASILFVIAAAGKTLFALARTIMLDVREEEHKRYKAGYHRGYFEAMEKTAKYPMGIYTFLIACANCENLGSDKCADCKAEKESGFIPKRTEEE